MNTKKMATAAAIVLEDGTATYEPLYSGKDLMELYPTAKKIILFPSVYEAAIFAQKLKRTEDNVKEIREKYPAGTALELDYMDEEDNVKEIREKYPAGTVLELDYMDEEDNVKEIREKYPAGTVLELDYMDDVQAPPKGSRMTVTYVDDMETIHGNWNNGSTIGLVPSCDRFHVVDTEAFEPDRSK